MMEFVEYHQILTVKFQTGKVWARDYKKIIEMVYIILRYVVG